MAGLLKEDPKFLQPAIEWFNSHPAVVARRQQIAEILQAARDEAEGNGEDVDDLRPWLSYALQVNVALNGSQGRIPTIHDWPGWEQAGMAE
ncbi:hypothetical protein [Mycolicibacterium palauense]|uniref:hypothetical protein n=1 Tax=Mycolicibacterium palauense TaxID=2034511 RepID=UPI0011460F48|nr:hypothetical protein [Mycolicibacterium palauense]